jgi:hypothetical protein
LGAVLGSEVADLASSTLARRKRGAHVEELQEAVEPRPSAAAICKL